MKNEFTLTKKEHLTKTVWGFSFTADKLPNWQVGQYMEWVLPHTNADKRGTRRFFTIASSPTEKELMIATKIVDQPSSFKNALRDLNIGDSIIARGVEGDFVLPKNPHDKLVFVAGGIGITPFRAMTKYLLDTNEKRDIVLLYSNKNSSDVAFSDIFNEAKKNDIKTINFFTDGKGQNTNDTVYDFITLEEIQTKIPDWRERTFYVSGPEPMVETFEKMLKKMGVKSRQLKTDFFPGYESI